MKMKVRLVSFALLALAGCDDIPQTRTESEIRRIAAEGSASELQRIEGRITAQDEEMRQLKADLNDVRGVSLNNADAHERLRKTFNGNVDMDNKAKAAAMTAAGSCGQEWVRLPDGATAWRNRVCTVKDMR